MTALSDSYDLAKQLNASHGRTYYLATMLLPEHKRKHVHALYGYARWADEVVDDVTSTLTLAEKEAALRGPSPLDLALEDTLQRWDIPRQHVDDFLDSMLMDLTVSAYGTWVDLMGYVHGSASVIGLQMLPLLEPVVPRAVAEPYAVDLGVAFQLTNFIRDVGEDLGRGRVYLPQEDLAAFGVTTGHLRHCALGGRADGPVQRLIRFEVLRTRDIYRSAQHGVRLLHPTSRPCIETALALYGGILDEVERAGYQVLDRRVSVSLARRARVALPGLVRARAARRTTSTS